MDQFQDVYSFGEEVKNVCEVVKKITNADHCGYVKFDENYKKGKVIADYPETDLVGIEFDIQKIEPEQELVLNHRPIIISDVSEDTTLGNIKEVLEIIKIKSTLIVPVICNQKVVGSFSLDMIEEKRVFTQEDIELCQKYAKFISLIIKDVNINLNQKKIINTSIAYKKSDSKSDLLESIIIGASELINAKGGGIYEYSEIDKKLRITVCHNLKNDLCGSVLDVGKGLAGSLVKENKPYEIVRNYNEWSGMVENYKDEEFGEVLEVLLSWQQKIFGVIFLVDRVGRNFTVDDAVSLWMYGQQTIHSLNYFYSIDQFKKKTSSLEALSKASKKINKSLLNRGLRDSFQIIATHAKNVLMAETVAVFLLDPDDLKIMRLKASIGHDSGKDNLDRVFNLHDVDNLGLTGWIAYRGVPVNWDKEMIENHPARNKDNPQKDYHMKSTKSNALIMYPLKVKDEINERIIGWIKANNKLDEFGKVTDLPFTKDDAEKFWLFADDAVVSIQLADLVHKLKERDKQLSILNEFAWKTIELFDEKEIRDEIVRTAKELFQAENVNLWLFDSMRKEFIENQVSTGAHKGDDFIEFSSKPPSKGGTSYKLLEDKFISFSDINSQDANNYISKESQDRLIQLGFKSMLGFCIYYDEDKLGVMYANFKETQNFSDKYKRLSDQLNLFSSLALIKNRLYNNLNQLKEAILSISEMFKTNEIYSLLSHIHNELVRLSSADRVVVYIPEFDKPALVNSSYYLDSEEKNREINVDELYRSFIADSTITMNENGFHQISPDRIFNSQSSEYESCFIRILKEKDIILGLIFCLFKNPNMSFYDSDLETLNLFCSISSLAINDLLQKEQLKTSKNKLFLSSTLALMTLLSRDFHKVRALTEAIKSNAEIIKMNLSQESNRDIIDRVSGIHESASFIDFQIRESFKSSRELLEEINPYNITKFLTQLIHTYGSDSRFNHINYISENLPDKELLVNVNIDALMVIFENLVSNSKTAMENNESEATIEFLLEEKINSIIVSVIDNGKNGFDTEILRSINKGLYNYFSDNEFTSGLGLGVGLAITNLLVEYFNGRIILPIKSYPGMTKISIEFPKYLPRKEK